MQKQTTHPPVPAQCGEVNVQPVSTVTVGYLGPPAFISASQAQHEASFAVLLGIVLHSPNQLAAAAVSPMVQFNLPDLSSPAETEGPDSGCRTTGHGHAHCVNVGPGAAREPACALCIQ